MPCVPDRDEASANDVWRATAISQIHTLVFLLDLAAQRAWTMVKRIPDQQARHALTGQIKTIEELIQVARDMARKL
jgi:hypothetical protein